MKANAIGQCIERAGEINAGVLLLYVLLQYADGRHVYEGHFEMRASDIAEGVCFSPKQYARALRILSKSKLIELGRSSLGAERGRSRPGTRISIRQATREWALAEGLLPRWSVRRSRPAAGESE
jgi:hypothetical protein